jgi:hypothetical protein
MPRNRRIGPLVEDALDVESSEEEEAPESSTLQEHNAIHGREQREIVTPNVLGTSRFKMKASVTTAFLGCFQARCVSTAAIGANCLLLQARRLANSTHRFRRRAGGHTRELVQYMPCPKCEKEIIKITLLLLRQDFSSGFIFSRTKTFEWLSGTCHGRLWHLGFRDVLRRV